MKIVSWNVNGIRACLEKGFLDFVKRENPDIICLQEIKAHPEQVDIGLVDYEHHFWNSAERKGYSGVAIFSKLKPMSVKYGFGVLDKEGRVITLEFDEYFLVTAYVPNSKHDLSRLELREKEWGPKFLEFIKELGKPVILCGDLNVAHKEIDLKNPKNNMTTEKKPGNPGFTDQERRGFDCLVSAGYIDSFRYFHPEEVKYSWWGYKFNLRARNIGWRIDYFCVDEELKDKMEKAEILTEVMGSDHCPVVLEMDL